MVADIQMNPSSRFCVTRRGVRVPLQPSSKGSSRIINKLERATCRPATSEGTEYDLAS